MYIAIDLGGTNVRIAGCESLVDVKFGKIERFELSHDFEEDFQKIVDAIKDVARGKMDAIGMGTPGTHDETKGFLISAKNLPEWENIQFVQMLSDEFNCSVYSDNDAVVASLGEVFYGQGNGKDFLYVTWGTGVGGTQVKWNGGKASSEKINWEVYLKKFEDSCGGRKIAERFGKPAEELDESEWTQVMNDFVSYMIDVSEKLDEKNIILGGGATSKQKERLQRVVEELKKEGINLIISNLDDDSGLYGALALIKIKNSAHGNI